MNEVMKIETVRNVEAETVVLGALMIDNRSIDRVADKLTSEDFFEPVHGRIFTAIVREASLGRTANPVTLHPYFKDDPSLNELGGYKYLATLVSNHAVLIGVDTCAEQVRDMAKRRRLADGLNEAVALASNMDVSNEDVVNAADAAISSISDNSDGVVQISAGRAFDEMLASYDEPRTGVRCRRIGALDEALGPIRKHHLVIVGGRPGMGKTVLGLSYGIGAALNSHGVLFVSIEMHREELMQRAAADICFDGRWGVGYDSIRDGTFRSDTDRRKVYEAGRIFRDMPLHIVDAGSLTIGRLNMIVRRYKRRMEAAGQKLELVIVDYLQRMRPDHRANGQYEAITEVSVGLKSIAKTHDVGVMALAQLSRKVEERPDKRPQLSDLRDSGQIEQDADAVVFLYREEYYLRKALPAETDPKYFAVKEALDEVTGKIELIVAKRRNGPEATAHAAFWGAFQTIRDVD